MLRWPMHMAWILNYYECAAEKWWLMAQSYGLDAGRTQSPRRRLIAIRLIEFVPSIDSACLFAYAAAKGGGAVRECIVCEFATQAVTPSKVPSRCPTWVIIVHGMRSVRDWCCGHFRHLSGVGGSLLARLGQPVSELWLTVWFINNWYTTHLFYFNKHNLSIRVSSR